MDRFLERHRLPKLTQQESDNSNNICVEQIEVVIKTFLQREL